MGKHSTSARNGKKKSQNHSTAVEYLLVFGLTQNQVAGRQVWALSATEMTIFWFITYLKIKIITKISYNLPTIINSIAVSVRIKSVNHSSL